MNKLPQPVALLTKERYDELSYQEQERFLKRCWRCGMKSSPFDVTEFKDHVYCGACVTFELGDILNDSGDQQSRDTD